MSTHDILHLKLDHKFDEWTEAIETKFIGFVAKHAECEPKACLLVLSRIEGSVLLEIQVLER